MDLDNLPDKLKELFDIHSEVEVGSKALGRPKIFVERRNLRHYQTFITTYILAYNSSFEKGKVISSTFP